MYHGHLDGAETEVSPDQNTTKETKHGELVDIFLQCFPIFVPKVGDNSNEIASMIRRIIIHSNTNAKSWEENIGATSTPRSCKSCWLERFRSTSWEGNCKFSSWNRSRTTSVIREFQNEKSTMTNRWYRSESWGNNQTFSKNDSRYKVGNFYSSTK